jgi:hypothetical protein
MLTVMSCSSGEGLGGLIVNYEFDFETHMISDMSSAKSQRILFGTGGPVQTDKYNYDLFLTNLVQQDSTYHKLQTRSKKTNATIDELEFDVTNFKLDKIYQDHGNPIFIDFQFRRRLESGVTEIIQRHSINAKGEFIYVNELTHEDREFERMINNELPLCGSFSGRTEDFLLNLSLKDGREDSSYAMQVETIDTTCRMSFLHLSKKVEDGLLIIIKDTLYINLIGNKMAYLVNYNHCGNRIDLVLPLSEVTDDNKVR